MRFQISFHGPFRVAAGAASDGLDDTFDARNPLPATSLKGLLRAQAKHLLTVREEVVDEVFGSSRIRSPWWWSDAAVPAGPARVRTRIRIGDTHTTVSGALVTAGELWPTDTAFFDVEPRDPIPAERIPVHEAVLAAAARAVTALGSDRRRGLGWVSITLPDRPWDALQQRHLQQVRSRHA
jgi:hypothetical protein